MIRFRMWLADWIGGGDKMWDMFLQLQDDSHHHEMASLRYRIALRAIIAQPERAVELALEALE